MALDLDDDKPLPHRKPHLGDLWSIVKWVLLAVGFLLAVVALFVGNAIQLAALAGLACFLGIASRIAQAEQHRYPL